MDNTAASTTTPAEPATDKAATASSPRGLSRFEKISVGLQASNLVALVVYTAVAYNQFSIMRSQLYAMAGSLAITAVSPYSLVVGRKQKISFTVENPRTTPAQIKACKVRLVAIPSAEPHPDIDNLPGLPVSCSGTVVHALSLSFEPAETLTQKGLDAIQTGTIRLYFVGKLNYDDRLGRRQWLPFCKVYAGTDWQDCQQIIIPTT